jgi:hypothetical protein
MLGAISLSVPSHFPPIAYSKLLNPVILPPGRERLSTNPAATGREAGLTSRSLDLTCRTECAARLLSGTPESRGDFRLSKEKPRGEAGPEVIGPCGWREIRPRLQRARRYAVRQYEFLSNPAQSVGGTPKTKEPSARASERRSLHRLGRRQALSVGCPAVTQRSPLNQLRANACIATSRVASKPCTGSWPSLKARFIDHTHGLLWCRRELDSVILLTICASAITSLVAT